MVQAIRRQSLPIQLTSFVGRARELAELTARLREYRLVTLTGAGGVGKTRLALAAAAAAQADYPDGVWAVELASLSEDVQVARAVVGQLGLEPREPVLLLPREALADRQPLVSGFRHG